MLISGLIGFAFFGGIGVLLDNKGHRWVAYLFLAAAALFLAGTPIGDGLHHVSAALLNGLIGAVSAAAH